MIMKKTNAFTLAEALVVIAILAIIATLTIPTVRKRAFEEQTATQLKKTYFSLEQALDSAMVDNGPIENWTGDKFTKYILPQLKIIKKCDGNNINDCFKSPITGMTTAVVLSDKSAIGNVGDDYYIDVNGPSLPNQLDVDIFKFTLKETSEDEVTPNG